MTKGIDCNTLWIGASLGPLERACLRSVVRQGHRLVLWCYRVPAGVPKGVEIADARAILPEDSVIRHRSGSPSLFSNRFRYELQRHGLGVWLDSDVYLLKPLPDSPTLMGLENPAMINGAVLRIPQDSPMIPDLLSLFHEHHVPPWLPLRDRVAAYWRRLTAGRAGIERMPWGVAGPSALTAIARRHGRFGDALPPSIFYPVHWSDAEWILSPGMRLEDRISPDTIALHLWNQLIRHCKHRAPPGSFLARLWAEAAAPA